jgi:hypothetical protein
LRLTGACVSCGRARNAHAYGGSIGRGAWAK